MKQEQIQEWVENPVTRDLHQKLTSHIEDLREAKGECFFPGDPQQTQEKMAELIGRITAWEDIISLLEGDDWDFFMKEEEDEQFRDNTHSG